MSRLPAFDPLDAGRHIPAIPAIPATSNQQNSGNSKNSRWVPRQEAATGFPESEVSEEQLTTSGMPIDQPDPACPEVVVQPDILAHLGRRTELINLPWPVGYGGLPVDQVIKAKAQNDRLGVKDPVDRRLNAMMWLWAHYRDRGESEMARQLRAAYRELRHADPSIQEICGLCEYESPH